MSAPAANKKRTRRQHRDLNQLPDSALIYLHELVKDPRDPDRIPALPFDAATLWRNIDDGRFPGPVYKRCGWRIGAVRAWIRSREALALPTPDSAQSTTKLFSAAPLSTRGSTTAAVRRVRKPGATPVTEERDAASLNAPVQQGVDQVVPPTDSAQTESRNGMTVGESYDVRPLLTSIFAGATA